MDKACFQHDMAYGKYQNLEKRTQSDKVLKEKAFRIANNPKYDGYQRGLASMVYKLLDKKSKGAGIKSMPNHQLANKLHKPIIRKLKKRKVHSSFKDNIWGVDLADMQLISKYNKGIRYLLCAIDLFNKYVFVVPLKDKKGPTIADAFKVFWKIQKENQIRYGLIKAGNFTTLIFKKWLKGRKVEMYSTHYEGKSVVAERFIRTSKNKIYKHMTANSENVYFNVSNDIIDKYNNRYKKTIKMKPIDVKRGSFVEYNEEYDKKDPKFKVGDHVRILKYNNIFAKGCAPNWSEEIFVIKQIKNTLSWSYVISDLNGEEIIGSFYKKELQKTNQKKIRIEKIIKRKGNKLYGNGKDIATHLIAGLQKRIL